MADAISPSKQRHNLKGTDLTEIYKASSEGFHPFVKRQVVNARKILHGTRNNILYLVFIINS